MKPCVYILANRRNGFLYVGVTSNIRHRLAEHQAGLAQHTERYSIKRLVYFEHHNQMPDAIMREKHLKRWKRAWKIRLIEGVIPNWNNLSRHLTWFD